MPQVPSPYCNNLRLGDPVLIVSLGRKAKVARAPREASAGAIVIPDGIRSRRYVHISDLRLIVEGVPEDVPPCDGPVPQPPPPIVRTTLRIPSPIHHPCGSNGGRSPEASKVVISREALTAALAAARRAVAALEVALELAG